ncbi:DUF6364 family protein [Catalinimonas sp. 4WD22]|uniref:DUF6364 family protein n=1 Tax=Catalinimonas locisalis TaxID=3133978 RepID=UPI003100FC7A
MNTKLTLTLDKETIEQAKKYASEQGRSLSEIVENYFKFLTEHKTEDVSTQMSPKLKRLKGVMKVDANFDYKKVLDDARNNKYGR